MFRMTDLKYELDKLDDSNYSVWEFKVRSLVQREGLLDYIDTAPPEVTDDEWSKNDGRVKSILLFSISDSQLIHIRKCTTSYETWNVLKQHHQKSSLFSKVILFKKICQTVYDDNESMVDHINNMKGLFDKLTLIGEEVSDSMIVAFLLSSLPESYGNVVMSLETRTEDQLTSAIVVDRLVAEYERRVDDTI